MFNLQSFLNILGSHVWRVLSQLFCYFLQLFWHLLVFPVSKELKEVFCWYNRIKLVLPWLCHFSCPSSCLFFTWNLQLFIWVIKIVVIYLEPNSFFRCWHLINQWFWFFVFRIPVKILNLLELVVLILLVTNWNFNFLLIIRIFWLEMFFIKHWFWWCLISFLLLDFLHYVLASIKILVFKYWLKLSNYHLIEIHIGSLLDSVIVIELCNQIFLKLFIWNFWLEHLSQLVMLLCK